MAKSATRNQVQTHARAVVWISRDTAKIFSIRLTGANSVIVPARFSSPQLQRRVNSVASSRVKVDPAFFTKIGQALQRCAAVLIIGPGSAKLELLQLVRPSLSLLRHIDPSRRMPSLVSLGEASAMPLAKSATTR
jgi:hypothetical protein